MLFVVVPMLPALVNKVTPNNVHIPIELNHLFAINWLYGFVASCVLYHVFNILFPDRRTLIPHVIHGDTEVVEGAESNDQNSTDGVEGRAEKGFEAKEALELGTKRE
jgi:nucleobase:cation symporter-1, NCS1 family